MFEYGALLDEELIDRIYEAGIVPDLWPAVLDDLTVVGNGFFTAMFSLGKGEWRWLASKQGVRIGEEYIQ